MTIRVYQCLECRRTNSDPLEMKECGIGCGGIFCMGCLPDHEAVCGKPGISGRVFSATAPMDLSIVECWIEG